MHISFQDQATKIILGFLLGGLCAATGVIIHDSAQPTTETLISGGSGRGPASDPPANLQTFAKFSPAARAYYDRLANDIRKAEGKLGAYLRQNVGQYNSEVANLAGNTTDPDLIKQAHWRVRAMLIQSLPELSDSYLKPLVEPLRQDLRAFGFNVSPPSDSGDFAVTIKGARGAAALTPMGKAVNRAMSKYNTPLITDPMWSLRPDFAQARGAFYPRTNEVQINFASFLGTDPFDLRSSSNVIPHEFSHARDAYTINSGIRNLNSGWVKPELAQKYLLDNSPYAKQGFTTDEIPAHRITAVSQNEVTGSGVRRGHAMAAAALEMKIELYNGIDAGTTRVGSPSQTAHYPQGRGTLIADAASASYVIIADKDNATREEMKEFLRQSISKSILAMEFFTRSLQQHLAVETDVNSRAYFQRMLLDLNNDAIKLQPVLEGASPEIFGPRLTQAPAISEPGLSAVTRSIESLYGSLGEPQKMAAFEGAVEVLGEMGGDFGQPKSSSTSALEPAAMSKLDHLEKVSQGGVTGEAWSAAEVGSFPDAGVSRGFAKNLTVGVKASNAVGVVLMSATGVAAIRDGNFGSWLAGTAVGVIEFGIAQVGVQIAAAAVGGVAAFNPAGAAFVIGATLGGLIDLTLGYFDPTGQNSLDFVSWASTVGSSIGSPLTRLMYAAAGRNPFGAEVANVIAGSRYVPLVLPARTVEALYSAPANSPTPESSASAIISGMGLGLVDIDPTPAISYNFLLANPGTGAAVDYPALVVPAKEVRLQIQLRFVCSAWLFLQSDPNSGNPSQANSTACTDFGNAAASYVQNVFANSGLPVDFSHTSQVEAPQPYAQFTGRDTNDPQNKVNAANNMNVMPAVYVTSSGFSRTAFTETAIPFYSTSCGNSASTTTVAGNCFNGDLRCNSSGQVVNRPTCPNCQITAPRTDCLQSCECRPPFGPQFIGGQNIRYITNTGGNCPAYSPYADSGRNACGAVVGWTTNTPNRPGGYSLKDTDSARTWLKSNYPSPGGAWTITIGVTPFASGSAGFLETFSGGASSALFDARTNTVLTENGPQTGVVSPSNLFSNYGYMVVAKNGPAPAQTVAHMIGHLFGGVHEVENWGGSAFYGNSYTNLVNREAAAYSGSIMTANPLQVSRAQFTSNIPVGYSTSALGDYRHNNRNQIVRTLMFLSNNHVFERPTGIESFGAYSENQPPQIAVPPPSLSFEGSVSTNFQMGSNGSIDFVSSSLYPIVSSTCSVDGGPAAACDTPTSFSVPNGLSAGNHTLVVTITDSNGQSTTAPPTTFYVDPSGVIAIINALLLED